MKRRTKATSLRPNATILFWLGIAFYGYLVLPKLMA